MCVIVYNPIDAEKISHDVFLQCWKDNPDGFGIMWSDNNQLKVWKTLTSVNEAWRKYLRVRNRQRKTCALHFRKATHGAIKEEHCHPFFVDDNLAVMHNGVLRDGVHGYDTNGKVDTVLFVENVLRKLPSTWIEDEHLRQLVQNSLGNSKLLFMTNAGRVYILNKSYGRDKDGSWYSRYVYPRTNYSSNYNSYDHYGVYSNRETKYRDHRSWSKNNGSSNIQAKKENRIQDNSIDYIKAYVVYDQWIICKQCLPTSIMHEARRITDKEKKETQKCQTCLAYIY